MQQSARTALSTRLVLQLEPVMNLKFKPLKINQLSGFRKYFDLDCKTTQSKMVTAKFITGSRVLRESADKQVTEDSSQHGVWNNADREYLIHGAN